jgi:hypothetical protein
MHVTDLNPTNDQASDPAQLPLHELRATRADLQAQDDVVSYVRRVAQARLDLVDAEISHRNALSGAEQGGPETEISGELRNLLGHHMTGGPARPPRPADDASEHPLALEFEALCMRFGIADLTGLDDAQLAELREQIAAYEHRMSHDRQDLFHRIDALSAELVRRYRDGEADVDGLLADG